MRSTNLTQRCSHAPFPPSLLPVQLAAIVLVTLAVVASGVSAKFHTRHHHKHNDDALRQRMIDEVNSKQTTWTAGWNSRFAGKPIDAIKRQLGVLDVNPPAHKRPAYQYHTGFDIAAIPDSFDARQQWPECPTMSAAGDRHARGERGAQMASVLTGHSSFLFFCCFPGDPRSV